MLKGNLFSISHFGISTEQTGLRLCLIYLIYQNLFSLWTSYFFKSEFYYEYSHEIWKTFQTKKMEFVLEVPSNFI